jgi:hypothetical protein
MRPQRAFLRQLESGVKFVVSAGFVLCITGAM